MAKDSAEIMDGDEESDVAYYLLQICGVREEEDLTREIWEAHIDNILDFVRGRSFRRVTYLIYGYFTLLLGAELPSHLRPAILDAADWKHEDGYWLDPDFILERKFYLEDFSSKIRDYYPGKPVHLVRLKNFDEDIKCGIVGLDQFWEYVNSKKIFSVEHVNLDSCDLSEIPEPIYDMKNIKTLSLEHNQIKVFPEEIGKLKSLKELFLNGSRIEILPDSIGDLTNLEKLYLNDNELKKIPEAIGKLSSLDILVLSGNPIKIIPKSILALKNLSSIYLRNTKMNKIPDFLMNGPFHVDT